MEPLSSSPLAHLKPVIEAAVHARAISTNGEGESVAVLKERNGSILPEPALHFYSTVNFKSISG